MWKPRTIMQETWHCSLSFFRVTRILTQVHNTNSEIQKKNSYSRQKLILQNLIAALSLSLSLSKFLILCIYVLFSHINKLLPCIFFLSAKFMVDQSLYIIFSGFLNVTFPAIALRSCVFIIFHTVASCCGSPSSCG